MSDKKFMTIEGVKITLYHRDNSPNIFYYFTLNKKSFKGSTGTSDKTLAIEFSLEKHREIKRLGGIVKKPLNFIKIVTKFLDFKRSRVSPHTIRDYTLQSKFLIEYFQTFEIKNIRSKDFTNYHKWRIRYYELNPKKVIQTYERNGRMVEGRTNVEPGNFTINREIGLLRNIMGFCRDELEITDKILIPKWNKLKEPRREKILEKEEYLKIIDYFSLENCFYSNIIRFVNNTGIRYPSELITIKWKDIHLEKKYFTVLRKGKVIKSVPIIGTTRNILEKLREREGIPKGPDDFVFVNNEGKVVKSMRKSWLVALDILGIDKTVPIYSLRALFATRMLRRPDISVKVIADILGHSDLEMIQNHYGHLKIEDLIKILQSSDDKKQDIIKSKLSNK